MPEIVYYRIWCKTCQEFSLHNIDSKPKDEDDVYTCKECATLYTEVQLKDIPEDKRNVQRERWRHNRGYTIANMYQRMLMPSSPFASMLLEDAMRDKPARVRIMESDAGEKAIEEYRRQKIEEEIKRRKDLISKFAGAQRNDKCRCGSGKKFKKCCLPEIESFY